MGTLFAVADPAAFAISSSCLGTFVTDNLGLPSMCSSSLLSLTSLHLIGGFTTELLPEDDALLLPVVLAP